jgi:hypothetical protein
MGVLSSVVQVAAVTVLDLGYDLTLRDTVVA